MYDSAPGSYSPSMSDLTATPARTRPRHAEISHMIPPHAFFAISAIFHYLGPAFAVLLFNQLPVLGVAWLRIAAATAVFAVWRRPWRSAGSWSWVERRIVVALGITLGLMNASFYLSIARVPLGTVGAIEFLGPITLAALDTRGPRNFFALGLAVVGVGVLTISGSRASRGALPSHLSIARSSRSTSCWATASLRTATASIAWAPPC